KLTAAPRAARMAVASRSSNRSVPRMVSKVPPPVPMRSCRLVSIVRVLLSNSTRVSRQALRGVMSLTDDSVEQGDAQGHVLGGCHHLRRQANRGGDDQLAGHGQPFLDLRVYRSFHGVVY